MTGLTDRLDKKASKMSPNQRDNIEQQDPRTDSQRDRQASKRADHSPEPDAVQGKAPSASKAATAEAQGRVDRLVDYVNTQIELLAFDDPDPFVLRQMVQCLADPRRSTRLNLVESFSQIGEPATPFLLEGIKNHAESVVRRACCNALTNIGDPDAVPVLVKALTNDPDIGVKSAAAGALAKIGAPAFDSLRNVLASEETSESCKGHAAWAMASMSSEVSERLYRIMSDPSAAVRTAVIGAIAQLAQKQTAQPDQPAPPEMGRPQTGIRKPTKKSGAERVQQAMTILTEALNDHSPEVKIEAAANLARLNCQKAYQPLVACLKDPVAAVRRAAALALAKLGNPAAIEAISHLQQDAEESVQRVATLVIAQLQAAAETQSNPKEKIR